MRPTLLVPLLLSACDGTAPILPKEEPQLYETDCTDGMDEDQDGVADCDDSDCRQACQTSTEADCGDGTDNDGDALVDCADPDCATSALCGENCTDGIDNDADGRIDCVDTDCAADPACLEDCADRRDNDRDDLIDCADPDCAAACVEDCGDTLDNDQDGDADCADFDCELDCDEDCENGVDDDGDDLRDCADEECVGLPICVEVCGDGRDNDADGLTDCEDGECVEDPSCDEDCGDGDDNDLDGLTDCEDDDCAGDLRCATRTVQVTGGTAVLTHDFLSTFYFSLFGGGTRSTNENLWRIAATDVEGTVQVRLGTFSDTCNWSVESASFEASATGALLNLTGRTGFTSDGACGLTSSDLPTQLQLYDWQGYLPAPTFQVWYGGPQVDSTMRSTARSFSGYSFTYSFFNTSYQTHTLSPLEGLPSER